MKYLLFIIAICVIGCADSKEVIVNDICSVDSPPIMMPDEVVCNHSPSNNIEVVGNTVTYMCTKIGGHNED